MISFFKWIYSGVMFLFSRGFYFIFVLLKPAVASGSWRGINASHCSPVSCGPIVQDKLENIIFPYSTSNNANSGLKTLKKIPNCYINERYAIYSRFLWVNSLFSMSSCRKKAHLRCRFFHFLYPFIARPLTTSK